MASASETEEMEQAMLQIARRHRHWHIDKFNQQIDALKVKFKDITLTSPLISTWLSFAGDPENIQTLFPEVQEGAPLPHYLLTSRTFATDLAKAISDLTTKLPDPPRPARGARPASRARGGTRRTIQITGTTNVDTSDNFDDTSGRPSTAETSAGARRELTGTVNVDTSDNVDDTSGRPSIHAETSAGARPEITDKTLHDAPPNPDGTTSNDNYTDINTETYFGFGFDYDYDDEPYESTGDAEGDEQLNTHNSSVNPGQEIVIPEVVVANPSSQVIPEQGTITSEGHLNSPLNDDSTHIPEEDDLIRSADNTQAGQDGGNSGTNPTTNLTGDETTHNPQGEAGDQEANARTDTSTNLNIEYAGFDVHGIANSTVFGAEHVSDGMLFKFSDEQYACILMNGLAFELLQSIVTPENDTLRVDVCFRNDGTENADNETGWTESRRGVKDIKLGGTTIRVKKYEYSHWVKWVFQRHGHQDVLIHYLSGGREKKVLAIETLVKEIQDLEKALKERNEELRKLQQY